MKKLIYCTASGNIEITYPSYLEWIMKFFFRRVKIQIVPDKKLRGKRFPKFIMEDEFFKFKRR